MTFFLFYSVVLVFRVYLYFARAFMTFWDIMKNNMQRPASDLIDLLWFCSNHNFLYVRTQIDIHLHHIIMLWVKYHALCVILQIWQRTFKWDSFSFLTDSKNQSQRKIVSRSYRWSIKWRHWLFQSSLGVRTFSTYVKLSLSLLLAT